MLKKLEKQKVKEEVNTVRFEGGKFFFDLAKLVFAGVFLVGVMKDNPVSSIIYVTGAFVMAMFVLFGIILINNSKRRR